MRLTLSVERARQIKVWILVPAAGDLIHATFSNCIIGLQETLRQHGINSRVVYLPGDSLVTRARNNLAYMFMSNSTDSENHYSLWLDCDVLFDPQSVLEMLALDLDFVAAPYSKKGIHLDRIAEAARLNWPNDRMMAASGTPNVNWLTNNAKLDEPMPVLEAGTGFWLLKRKVFEQMQAALPEIKYLRAHEEHAHYGKDGYDYFRVGIWPETKEYLSEDWWFCSPPGQMVYGFRDTVKPIEEYETGDRVSSHLGESRAVLSPMKRYYRGDLIRVEPKYGWGFSFTPGHPIWVYRNGKKAFVPIEDMNLGDRLVVPVPKDYVVEFTARQTPPRNSSHVEKRFTDGVEYFRYTRTHKDSQWFPLRVTLNEDAMSILGYWAAEGSRDGNRAEFCFNASETEYADHVASLLESVFGLRSSIVKRKGTLTVRCSCTALADFLSGVLGNCASSKYCSSVISLAPVQAVRAFLRCLWRGDGTKDREFGITSTSAKMRHCIRFMLIRLGIYPSETGNVVSVPSQFLEKWLDVIGVDPITRSRSIRPDKHIIQDEDGFLVPIKSLNRVGYRGMVHNLSVAEDETYNLNGFAVHNCREWRKLGGTVWCCFWVKTNHIGPHLYPLDMPAIAELLKATGGSVLGPTKEKHAETPVRSATVIDGEKREHGNGSAGSFAPDILRAIAGISASHKAASASDTSPLGG